MYYFTDSPTVLTDLPNDLTCSIASTDDERYVAVLVNNNIFFHCQKSLTLLGRYRHKLQTAEPVGDLVFIAWNSTGDILLLRTDLGFICLLYLSFKEIDYLNHECSFQISFEITIKSVKFLRKLGQFICCIPTCNKIIAGDRNGRVICLDWLGEMLENEGFNLHKISVQSEISSNAVSNRIDPHVNCQNFYWAPTLNGFLATLTNGRLLLIILPLSRLDPKYIKALWLTSVEEFSAISVNSRFRGFAVGTSKGQIISYHLEETSSMLILPQKFSLPDPVRYGVDKMPRSVKAMAWSPDGYCLAVAWSPHGMALWSVFGSLLYSTLLDQTEVTRFFAPLNFCWTLKGFHLWTVSSFVDDPGRRAREECLNAFRERLLQSCNALPQTQRQVAKNLAKMRSDLHLDEDTNESQEGDIGNHRNRNFLMVFRLIKSALASNPIEDNHLHLLLCTPEAVLVAVRRYLHSRQSMLHVPLPPEYIRPNFPLKFAALNKQGNQMIVAGSRGFAVCSLASLHWRLFGNVTQERAFEVHAGLAWWGRFMCFCAFNYAANHCEIRCYPSTEKLDDRFSSILALDSSIRPLVLDVVGDRLVIFSTDSHYRSFNLSIGSKPHTVVLTPQSTFNFTMFFPHAVCLTRIFPFDLNSHSSSGHVPLTSDDGYSPLKSIESDGSTLLATYAGNLLLLPNLCSSSLTRLQNSSDNPLTADLSGFFGRVDANVRKYRDTFSPTLIASRVELLWAPATISPSSSILPRSVGLSNFSDSDEDEKDVGVCDNESKSPPVEGFHGLHVPTLSLFLSNTIWLFCGADGMRIWLPLETSSVRRSTGSMPEIPLSPGLDKKSFSLCFPLTTAMKTSRRVMISLGLDGLSYPLVIFIDRAVLVTVQSDYIRMERSYSDVLSDPCIQMPCCCVNIKTNLFLPNLLKDLLFKNLSDIAYDLASAYQRLPYFQHILELLLHEILEEEATSKSPIPDPLLPQAAAFIEQFPQFLDVVVQCTRKTEVTWWRHLFCALGRRPKDIFDHAISLDQLDTAASCLVILQNSEKQDTCKQCALLLLGKVIKESQWHYVGDLIRFLKATTLSEHSPDVVNEVDDFIENIKCRFLREGSWKSLEEIFANLAPHSPHESFPNTSENGFLDSAETFNSPLPQWLLTNRAHVMDVDDWPRCLLRLHADFGWFLPLGRQKDGTFLCPRKQPGFARAVNGAESESPANLEISSPALNFNSAEEIPTFDQALRTHQQIQLLQTHLILVISELNSSVLPASFGPSEEALFCWTLLVAILQLDKQAVVKVFSLLPPKSAEVVSSSLSPPPPLLLRILHGLEALECLVSANPQATPEYFNFFAELKPIIHKSLHPFMEPKKSLTVEKKLVRGPSIPEHDESEPNLANRFSVSRRTAERQAAIPTLLYSSMQTLKTQDHVAGDFESAADDHLVNPASINERSGSSCTIF